MKKKEPKKILNEFSWVYLFFVIIGIIMAILIPIVPGIIEAAEKVLTNESNVLLTLEVTIIVNVLIDLWYFYLLRRYTSGKSNGTLIMILLIIGVVGNTISMFFTKETASINLIINAVVLYFLCVSKKQGK